MHVQRFFLFLLIRSIVVFFTVFVVFTLSSVLLDLYFDNNNNNNANIYTGYPISSNKKNCYQKGPVIIS